MLFKRFQGDRIHFSRRLATRGVRTNPTLPEVVEQRFTKNGACRIPSLFWTWDFSLSELFRKSFRITWNNIDPTGSTAAAVLCQVGQEVIHRRIIGRVVDKTP